MRSSLVARPNLLRKLDDALRPQVRLILVNRGIGYCKIVLPNRFL